MRPTLALMVLTIGLVAGCSSTPAPTQNSSPGATRTIPQTLAPTQSTEPSPSTSALGVRDIDGAEFTRMGGCGDVFMWATTEDDSMAITVQWDGAATAAWENGAFQETAELPQIPVQVSLVAGSGLSRLYCNDVLMPGIGEDSNVHAGDGSAELTVRPDAGGFQPASHANVTLRELTFRVIFGTEEETWRLDELTMENVSVGWFPG
jgi:hypothetical protein